MKDTAPRRYRGPTGRIRKGLLIIYTGDGKGKSTAAFGAVFRSLGRGLKVAVVQFIKGRWNSGEIRALQAFKNQVDYFSFGGGFTWETKNLRKDKRWAENGWKRCIFLLNARKHRVYLFDELIYALKYGFLSLDEVMKGLEGKDPYAHVILTGRDVPSKLLAMADLVTEMREVKHPFRRGIPAQPGIDY